MSVQDDKIATAVEYLALNFKKQPELDEVAKAVHLSEYHFQRISSEWVGISPTTVHHMQALMNFPQK